MSPPQEIDFEQKRRFIIQLGKALHRFGTPAFRLEAHLHNLSEALDIHGEFLVTPTSLTFVFFPDEDEMSEAIHIKRTNPGGINLGALAALDDIASAVSNGEMTIDQAERRLLERDVTRPRFTPLVVLLAFGVSSASFSLIMRNSWADVWVSLALGIFVYIISLWSTTSVRVQQILEPTVAFLAGLSATLLASVIPGLHVQIVTLSAIIWYIPGLALTLGLSELGERHLSSGTARVIDATMSLFKLYFGAHIGLTVGALIHAPPPAPDTTMLHTGFVWPGVALISLGLSVIFNTRPINLVPGMLGGVLGYAFTLIGGMLISEDLGVFTGALMLGVYSNLYSRWRNTPASIILIQGVVVLVPGSKTYLNLTSQILGDSVIANQTMGSETFLIFISIVAGLTFANVLAPPPRSL
ncbi:threonine/serine ThrE exporter family protein [Sulfuriroseicoccus oceanibius]|uniref:Threonine/serine exporter family protein n=1 Tax=Sulfuriroseicoccus oceanibius TaxID=2707525 RepID=A0A6B3LE11_9BACT|nr:threonine/serine exporter family protein [Sulfuriroseicoccus oceanibius]QQL45131.1 threonine/serine exporter family protein [Sulfuriroseicoccus oceanibius]